MTDKVHINLSESEAYIIADINKYIITYITKKIDKLENHEKQFTIFTLAMVATLSNMLNNFGLHDGEVFEEYLEDFSCLVRSVHKFVIDNASYMEIYEKEDSL
jgi:hypothetical protein